MSARTVIVVIVALIFGGSAAYLVNVLRPGFAATGETVTVLVAATEIPRYTTMTSELLKTREVPKDLVPASVLRRVDEVIDRVVDVPLFRDEMILEAKLSGKGAGRGLAAVIPTGMRAVTIPTPNVASGVAGFVLPGNRVDVLLTMHVGHDSSADSTRTVLGNVEILAVDQRLEAPTANKVDAKELRSVTLLVSPDDAKKLALGQSRGTLHLSLRNPNDKEPVDPRVSTAADLHLSDGGVKDKPVGRESEKETQEVSERKFRLEKEKLEWKWKQEERAETKAIKEAKEKAEWERRNSPKIRELRGVIESEVTLPKSEANGQTKD